MDDKETLSFRTNKLKKKALDSIAKSIDRDRSYIINQALDNYLELHEWQITHINEGIRQANKGEFASQEKVQKVFNKFRKK